MMMQKKRDSAFAKSLFSAGARTRTWSSMKTGRANIAIRKSRLVLSPTRPVDTGRLWLTRLQILESQKKEDQLFS